MSSDYRPRSSGLMKPNLNYPSSSTTTSNQPESSQSAKATVEIERLNELESELQLAPYNRFADHSIAVQRQQLPIFKCRNQILYALETHRVVVMIGETGSGKSTQLPQYLLEAGWTDSKHAICVAEPRRIAAINLAKRVCEESGSQLGHKVGYSIRFEDCFLPGITQCKFVTDGLLIRELMQNPLLPQYNVIILDEVHERNVNTDIVIGLLKKVMKRRSDLKLILCSATINAEELKLFFDEGAKSAAVQSSGTQSKEKKADETNASHLSSIIISVEGRYYPIEIFYLKDSCDDYLKASIKTAFNIHMNHKESGDGDILIFLTGQDEVDVVVSGLIEKACQLKTVYNKMSVKKLWILPLYGSLSTNEQLKVFERAPNNTRKIIVATNIAETSLTINGIVYVIDCGFMKLKAYNSKLGSESLITVPISKSNAQQRAGRAGRYRSGQAYRLYPESEYEKLKENMIPEIQRCDLAPVIIQMKALGVDNICRFEFLSSPPASNMISSLELLHALEALDHNSKLTTPLGFQMAEFPLHPIHAKALLASAKFECTKEMLSIIAMLQVQSIFVTPSGRKQTADKAKLKFTCTEGDHITMLNVFKSFEKKLAKGRRMLLNWCNQNYLNFKSLLRAVQIRGQLATLLKKFKIDVELSSGDRVQPILKCLCAAFFINAAKVTYTGDYIHLKSNVALRVHPSSVINLQLANLDQPPPKYVIYNDIVQSKSFFLMRDLSVIDPNWLQELVPNYYEFGSYLENFSSDKRQKLS